jgi:hypothetical protein
VMAQKNPDFFPPKKSFLQSTYCWPIFGYFRPAKPAGPLCRRAAPFFFFFGRL